MFCTTCKKYRAPEAARAPAFCAACGGATTVPVQAQIAQDLSYLRFLIDELSSWSSTGLIDEALRTRLVAPYQRESEAATFYLLGAAAPPLEAIAITTVEAALPMPIEEAQIPAPPPPAVEIPAPPPPAPSAPSAPPAPDLPERLVREFRPVVYENLVLLLGAFLVFSGSIYFAIYFWDRLGSLGPLVAGSLLAVYALSFAGAGYVLQRRYQAALSARVLYGIAATILPVAITLVGEPIRDGGVAVGLVAASAVALWSAAAYPAILVASSLFQREIGRPFARAYVAVLLAVGLAPLVLAIGLRPLGIVYLYLAALPLLAMYRRVREVGHVFETATVVYVAGGSAYLLLAVAARVALLQSPGLTLPEVAPLVLLMATAAIDLDVAWRARSRAVRSALGVVGVVAHAAGVLAVVMAFDHPFWRVLTTLGAGLLFGVTALRHRQAYALHLALLAVAAGVLMMPWLPAIEPPRWAAMGGLLLLPLSLGLARLGTRWRRHAALAFAAPAELWSMLYPAAAGLSALLLPRLGSAWSPPQLGAWGEHLAALVVLPASAATLWLAWSASRRRIYLTLAVLAAAATVLVIARAIGAEGLGLASTAATLTLAVVGAATIAASRVEPRRALHDAALVLLAATVVLPLSTRIGPWHGTGTLPSVLGFLLVAAAAVAVAAGQPRREVGVVAVLSTSAAAIAALWTTLPHGLLSGVLCLVLLGLDRTKAQVVIGAARPFRDAYLVALAALLLQVVHVVGHAPHPERLPPLESALVGLALLAIAARRRSPWPTYGAFGFFLAAGFGVPAALDLASRPISVAKGVGLALIVVALGCRLVPRLRPWRTIFLDVPLHLAAVAAPFALLRFLWAFGLWATEGGPEAELLLRRVASPLALAVIAAITHGSRWHAYLSAVALVFAAPALMAAMGADGRAVSPALAAMAVVMWVAVQVLARRPRFARPVASGDRPLPLFASWSLPSAGTIRDLWMAPLGQVSLLAAAAAFAISLQRSVQQWPAGAAASVVAFGLVATQALLRCWGPTQGEGNQPRLPLAHAACAAIAALSIEGVHLAGHDPDAGSLLFLGLGYLLLAEALAALRHPGALAGRQAASVWAILALFVPLTLQLRLTDPTTPLCAALLVVAVVRFGGRHPVPGIRTATSVTSMAAVGFVVLFLLGLAGWLRPAGAAVATMGFAAALGGWGHWVVRTPLQVKDGEAIRFASAWAIVGAALALASTCCLAPASAPGFLAPGLGILTIALAAAWFIFAAIRTGHHSHGYAAQGALLLLYLQVRLSPVGAEWSAELDAVVAIGAAFALQFASELLGRSALPALGRPATFGARMLPLAACMVISWDAMAGHGSVPTLEHALMAETMGVLYTIGFRRGGHRALGLVAMCCYNLGLVLLWMHTGQRDALYYSIPVGASIVLLARIYRTNLGPSARRGLRTAGCLLIYLSTYIRVVQFDSGIYALMLGGVALVGLTLGFLLRLRDLFLLSAGFLVLDVLSNLTYYGAHRPVLGWTLLTATGLGLTASGVLFQMHRAQVLALVARARTTLTEWD